MKFEIEFAKFTKIEVEAKSKEEAENMAAVMEEEEITEHDTHEYYIWDITKIN